LETLVSKLSKKREVGVTTEFQMVKHSCFEKQNEKLKRTLFKLEFMNQLMEIQKIVKR